MTAFPLRRRRFGLFLACCAAMPFATPVLAGEIALIAPASGGFSELGGELTMAAERAFEDAAAPVLHDSACTDEGGAAAARRAIADGAKLIIGFLCTESLKGALPELEGSDAVVLTLNIRSVAVRREAARHSVALFHLTPPDSGEAEAIARLLPERWRTANFAIVDDGTIGARDLALAFRRATEERGLTPVYIDNFRPQLSSQVALIERLKKAGADHVFVGGDRADIAVIARDAARRELALQIAGGETLRAADEEVPLDDGILMVGLGELGESGPDTPIASRYYWRALAAAEIALWLDFEAGDITGQLAGNRFETSVGEVAFDASGYWTGEPYGLYVSMSGDFVPVPETEE